MRPSAPVRVPVNNTGKRAGIELACGEQNQVTVAIPQGRLTVYDDASNSWKLVPGSDNLQVGGSSQDLPLHQPVSLQ